ncbi:MAG: extracellular solute-binding protein [Rhodospirillaceae bacterium]|nr:extracellular solute-binding protein [Rhodospirillaceae bacterium]
MAQDLPSQKSGEKPAATPPAEPRRGTIFTTGLLAVCLSAVLLVLLLGYLIVAPTPQTVRPAGTGPALPPAAANSVRFLAPRQFITPELLADFQTETGLTVELVSYDDDESVTPDSLAAGGADVVLASGVVMQRLRAQDRLNVLPARQIGNLGLIDPTLRSLAATYDKGGLHLVPFVWTSFGLGLNREAVAAKLGVSAATDTWGLVFDAATAGKLAACGIHSIASPSVAFPAALKFLGVSAQSDAPGDTERASALWEAARPFIATLDTASVSAALASGKACVAIASASEVYQARAQAREAGETFTLQFVQPREGTMLRLYLLGLNRFSANPARGAALVNYLLRPEVSARLTNSRWAANAVPASALYVRQDVKDDPLIYPDIGPFRKLAPDAAPAPATVSLRERFWLLMSAAKAPPS